MLENTIHSIVGLARAEKALFTVTGISLGPFLHIDPKGDTPSSLAQVGLHSYSSINLITVPRLP